MSLKNKEGGHKSVLWGSSNRMSPPDLLNKLSHRKSKVDHISKGNIMEAYEIFIKGNIW